MTPLALATADGTLRRALAYAEGGRVFAFDPSQPRDEDGRWTDTVDADQADAVLQQLRDPTFVNTALRHGVRPMTSQQMNHVDSLDSVLKNAPPLKSQMTLYRAVGENVAEKLIVGQRFVDKAYASTTETFSNAQNPGYIHPSDRWTLTIAAPVGTRALRMASVIPTTNPKATELAGWEREWLLPRMTEFEVISVNSKKRTASVRISAQHAVEPMDRSKNLNQHDYSSLKPRLDALEAVSLDALRDALSESRDALVTKIRKATDFAALANDLKRLPRFGAVEMEVRGMLDRAREAGRKDLRREVRESRNFADSSFKPKSALRWLRATAFWVSGILGDRVLADVKGIILNGLKTGTAGSVMAEQIFDAFLPWLGDPDVIRDEQQLQPWRLETIVRTNTTTAYNHGRLSEIIDPEIARFVKGIRYSAILDTRTTEVCRYLDGKVFKPSDPNLESLLPPNHYQCRSIIIAIVAGEQVREEEFITPSEIGRARELADAKFLAQDDAWEAYREREEPATIVHVPDPEAERRAADAVALVEAERATAGAAQARTLAAERARELAEQALVTERRANAAALKALAERPVNVTVQAPAAQVPVPKELADVEVENLTTGAKFKVTRTKKKE